MREEDEREATDERERERERESADYHHKVITSNSDLLASREMDNAPSCLKVCCPRSLRSIMMFLRSFPRQNHDMHWPL